jgi:hypothetical protein
VPAVLVAPLLVVVPLGAVVPAAVFVDVVVVCVVSVEVSEVDVLLLSLLLALDPVLAVFGDAATDVVIFACAVMFGTLVGAGAETCSLPQPATATAVSAASASAAMRRDGRPWRPRRDRLILRSVPSDGHRPGSR